MSRIVATFAGDSGDGVQLLGNAFSDFIANLSFEYNTLPDFPAEIRAPAGKIFGVSGFQIQWGDELIQTAGNHCDILVAFNAAAFKKYKNNLKSNGLLVYDPSGFDSKNCKLAEFNISELEEFKQNKLDIEFSLLTKNALTETTLSEKDKDKNKNIFALGFLVFGIGGKIEIAKNLLQNKFQKDPEQLATINHILSTGYNFAETIEFSFHNTKSLNKVISPGRYRNITGNNAIVLALAAAPKIFGRKLFFGGYPITPASEILHELSNFQCSELIVRQAEDEIASASMAIGAAYGGCIGVTASSGPGIDLKQEAIGLAHIAELPLLIIDIQRAGPSTGLPTKVEQSDLNLALNGRHGDCPVPVISISSPSDAYQTTIDAIAIMIQFQTPVFLLGDAAIAIGSEIWQLPDIEEMAIDTSGTNKIERNALLTAPWISPGEDGKMFILGGLERDSKNGMISYDANNHQTMTKLRADKIATIASHIPPLKLEKQVNSEILILSWGSTKGAINEAIEILSQKHNIHLSHAHLKWIFPLPFNFNDLIAPYKKIIIPELNNGQLASYLKQFTSIPILKINKVQGVPFFGEELSDQIHRLV